MAIKHVIRTQKGNGETREVSLTPNKAIHYQQQSHQSKSEVPRRGEREDSWSPSPGDVHPMWHLRGFLPLCSRHGSYPTHVVCYGPCRDARTSPELQHPLVLRLLLLLHDALSSRCACYRHHVHSQANGHPRRIFERIQCIRRTRVLPIFHRVCRKLWSQL